MLLDRADALKCDLSRHLVAKAAAKQRQAYRSRATQLRALAERLSQAHRDWAAMRAAGLAGAPLEPNPGLWSHAEDLLARFRADRAVLAEADPTFRFQFSQGIAKAADDFEGATRQAWDAHMATGADFPTRDVLAALDAIPGYRAPVQRIRDAAAEFARLRERAPSAAEIAAWMSQADAARRGRDGALEEMRGADLPSEVLAFLRSAVQGGAALADLTPPVSAWLEVRDLSGAFRIVPSGRD